MTASSNPSTHNLSFDALMFDLGSTLIYFEGAEDTYRKGNEEMYLHLQQAGLTIDRQRFLTEFWDRMQAYLQERDTEFLEHTTAYILRTLLSDYGIDNLPDSLVTSALKARYAVSQAFWKAELDTAAVLTDLKQQGYKLAIISNAGNDEDVQVLIDQAGIRPFFDEIITSAAFGYRKPNPKIFNYMLDRLEVRPERAAMIGDTLGADILGAKNIGMYSIWITRRADKAANRAHEDTVHPDAVIPEIGALPPLLEKLSKPA